MANMVGAAGRLWPALIFLSALLPSAGAQEPGTVPHVTLTEAIHRAEANEPVFTAALAAQRTAAIDGSLAKVALLPSVTYHNQALYTQPNGQRNQAGQVGSQNSPIFIANNAVREYASQASINETLGVRQFADERAAAAAAARASAQLEIARRGLVATVVGLYYRLSAAEKKQELLGQALREAGDFTATTREREAAREVAHADVLKAQLQQQQRERDLSDGAVAAEQARLELAVLLFPDPRTPYTTDAPANLGALPSKQEVYRQASANNPDVRSAMAALNAAKAEVTAAKAAYLPDLALNLTYGIDAPQFAVRGPQSVKNLGYSLSGTLDIPVWDWFSTQKRVKQSEIRRGAAETGLSAAQRRLIATFEGSYADAAAANQQMVSLGESVQTALESLRLTKLRYLAGEATALEVVDAQDTLLATQTAKADGTVRYETDVFSLQILMGTL